MKLNLKSKYREAVSVIEYAWLEQENRRSYVNGSNESWIDRVVLSGKDDNFFLESTICSLSGNWPTRIMKNEASYFVFKCHLYRQMNKPDSGTCERVLRCLATVCVVKSVGLQKISPMFAGMQWSLCNFFTVWSHEKIRNDWRGRCEAELLAKLYRSETSTLKNWTSCRAC